MNTLYPIFLKTEILEILVVGGGYVAEEKLSFLFKSSPNAHVTLVAPFIRPATLELCLEHQVKIVQRNFEPADVEQKHLVITTTDSQEVNLAVREEAKARHILVNVADCPEFCDFYLGGIVTKGNLKIAISTNGKSPTMAKRMRQLLEEVIPDEIEEVLNNLHTFRKTLKGSFQEKVTLLNDLTKDLIVQKK